MFERFTDRARRVVVLAQEEARIFQHGYIGTEHLLIALARSEVGAGTDEALALVGLDDKIIRSRVLEAVGRGAVPAPGHLPFTQQLKKVLEGALRTSLQMGDSYIAPEHLLLSLINHQLSYGVAGTILAEATPEGAPTPLYFDKATHAWFTWDTRPDKVSNTGEVDAMPGPSKNQKTQVDDFRRTLREAVGTANEEKLMLAALALGLTLDDVVGVNWKGRVIDAR
jgi:ATP-dependent Clp protease ATP-binding subunit ClpA